MTARELLDELLREAKLNTNSLAAVLRNKPSQAVIYRFLHSDSKEPRRSTLKPIADYFNIPLDALTDDRVAHRIAIERGFVTRGIAPPAEAPPPPPRAKPEDIVIQFDELLKGLPPATKRSALALLSGLADEEHDPVSLGKQLRALLDAANPESSMSTPRTAKVLQFPQKGVAPGIKVEAP